MTEEKLNVTDIHIGDTFTSRDYTVTKEEIIEFAKKYDPQFFHVDEELAKESFFGELVSSGWLVTALSMRLFLESVRIEHGFVGAQVNLRWPLPTYPGDTIHVVSEVLDMTPAKKDPNKMKITSRIQTFNQKDELCYEQETKTIAFVNNPAPKD